VVRRQTNLAIGGHREAIPAARWFLSPWPTLKLWRRMVLWRVNSYPRALDQEKMRLGAIAAAREMYGRLWRYRISPLTRLQINLGELGAHDLRPGIHDPEVAAPSAPAAGALAAGPGAAHAAYDAPQPAVVAAQHNGTPNGAASAAGPAHAVTGPHPNGQQPQPQPSTPAPAPGAGPGPGAHAAPNPVAGQRWPASAQRAPLQGPGAGTEPIPGVAVAGAAAAAAVPAQRAPAVGPHVEFQAPPPMPPMRRSTRESELLTAAREVERWRGLPSATRISRELGIGMPLATSLANALRDEDGPGPDEPAL